MYNFYLHPTTRVCLSSLHYLSILDFNLHFIVALYVNTIRGATHEEGNERLGEGESETVTTDAAA